jgi:hypothetical protein
MKTTIAIFALLVLVVTTACNKDKFTTVPQLRITDISPATVVNRNVIRIETKFTDQEGDLDSVLVVFKWYNGGTASRVFDTLRNSVDNLGVPSKLRDGEVFIEYAYGTVDGYLGLPGTPVAKDTTAAFGIVLKDKANNRSEYKETDQIRLLK